MPQKQKKGALSTTNLALGAAGLAGLAGLGIGVHQLTKKPTKQALSTNEAKLLKLVQPPAPANTSTFSGVPASHSFSFSDPVHSQTAEHQPSATPAAHSIQVPVTRPRTPAVKPASSPNVGVVQAPMNGIEEEINKLLVPESDEGSIKEYAKTLFGNTNGDTLMRVYSGQSGQFSDFGWSEEKTKDVIRMVPTWYANSRVLKGLLRQRSERTGYRVVRLTIPNITNSMTSVQFRIKHDFDDKSMSRGPIPVIVVETVQTPEQYNLAKKWIKGHFQLFDVGILNASPKVYIVFLHSGSLEAGSSMWEVPLVFENSNLFDIKPPRVVRDRRLLNIKVLHTSKEAIGDLGNIDTLTVTDAFAMRKRGHRTVAAGRRVVRKRPRKASGSTASNRRLPKVHKGPQGGLYVLKSGRKYYLRR